MVKGPTPSIYITLALVFSGLALTASIFSVSLPGWILDTSEDLDGNPGFYGLWMSCYNWTMCRDHVMEAYRSPQGVVWMTLWITQGLGFLLLVGSVCAGLVAVRRPQHILKARFIIIVSSMFAGFSIFSGVFVFLVVSAVTNRAGHDAGYINYYYSLFLAVTASGLAWISALVAALYHDFQIVTKRMSMAPGFDVINIGSLPNEPADLDSTSKSSIKGTP